MFTHRRRPFVHVILEVPHPIPKHRRLEKRAYTHYSRFRYREQRHAFAEHLCILARRFIRNVEFLRCAERYGVTLSGDRRGEYSHLGEVVEGYRHCRHGVHDPRDIHQYIHDVRLYLWWHGVLVVRRDSTQFVDERVGRRACDAELLEEEVGQMRIGLTDDCACRHGRRAVPVYVHLAKPDRLRLVVLNEYNRVRGERFPIPGAHEQYPNTRRNGTHT